MNKNRIVDKLLFILMLIQSSISLFYPPYKDTSWIKDTWFGNDLVTLMVVCPIFLVSLFSNKPRLLAINAGCISYAIYNYFFYMLGTHLNAMFLLYIAIAGLGIYQITIFLLLSKSGKVLDDSFDRSKSYKIPAIVFIFIGSGLGAIWIGFWANYVFFHGKLPTDESAFRLVAALDILIIVTAMILSGVALLRKKSLGFLLGSAIGVQGLLYLLVLTVNSIIISIKGATASSELPIWLSLFCIQAFGIVVLLVKNGKKNNLTTAST